MPRFRLPGETEDRFEDALYKSGSPFTILVRGEIAGDSDTPVAVGAFGTPNDQRFGPIPSTG